MQKIELSVPVVEIGDEVYRIITKHNNLLLGRKVIEHKEQNKYPYRLDDGSYALLLKSGNTYHIIDSAQATAQFERLKGDIDRLCNHS